MKTIDHLAADMAFVALDLSKKYELDVMSDVRAVKILVTVLARLAFGTARAADKDVTGVLVHVAEDNSVVVSLRRKPGDIREIMIDD